MNEEAGFIKHMEENPGDAHSALVFADWLEENGKPAHAEMIRLHHHPELGGWEETHLGKQPGGRLHYTDATESNRFTNNIHILTVPNEYSEHPNAFIIKRIPTVKQHGWISFSAHMTKQHAKRLASALSQEGSRGV